MGLALLPSAMGTRLCSKWGPQKEKILYEMKQSYNLLHIYSVFTVFSYTHYSIIFTIQLFTLFLKKWIKPKALLNNVIYLENILFHP